MSRYRIDCAVILPAACGLFGIAVGLLHQALGIRPHLTPLLSEAFSWWPRELAFSGCLIGFAAGVLIAIATILADIRQEAFVRRTFKGR